MVAVVAKAGPNVGLGATTVAGETSRGTDDDDAPGGEN